MVALTHLVSALVHHVSWDDPDPLDVVFPPADSDLEDMLAALGYS